MRDEIRKTKENDGGFEWNGLEVGRKMNMKFSGWSLVDSHWLLVISYWLLVFIHGNYCRYDTHDIFLTPNP